jgi:hypothetical protein
MHIIFLLFLALGVFAQHSEQPLQESSNDLRSGLILFSIEDTEVSKTYMLERTSNQDHFLRFQSAQNEEIIQKIDSREAKKLDMNFSSRFLRCQYEHPSVSGECRVTHKLQMKGERQEICEKDDKKSQEIKEFLTHLAQRL